MGKDTVEQVEMHIFVDASMIGYGAVAYFVRADKEVVWVAARSRVSPEKIGDTDVGGSVPRLELQSAVVGVELATQIREEVKVSISKNWFHTDSLTTYYRLQSKDKKQPVFVSNHVNKILLSTKAQEWRWVPSDLNPADVVSRGARPEEEEKWSLFYGGPDEDCWPEIPPPSPRLGVFPASNLHLDHHRTN